MLLYLAIQNKTVNKQYGEAEKKKYFWNSGQATRFTSSNISESKIFSSTALRNRIRQQNCILPAILHRS